MAKTCDGKHTGLPCGTNCYLFKVERGLTTVKCDGNHGGPPCSDPECWALDDAPGILDESRPLHLSLMPDEADYLVRLVSADQQRMVENRDHGVSHGMRGYLPPDLQHAERISHSLSMARTAAAIETIEAIEESRADYPDGTDAPIR